MFFFGNKKITRSMRFILPYFFPLATGSFFVEGEGEALTFTSPLRSRGESLAAKRPGRKLQRKK